MRPNYQALASLAISVRMQNGVWGKREWIQLSFRENSRKSEGFDSCSGYEPELQLQGLVTSDRAKFIA